MIYFVFVFNKYMFLLNKRKTSLFILEVFHSSIHGVPGHFYFVFCLISVDHIMNVQDRYILLEKVGFLKFRFFHFYLKFWFVMAMEGTEGLQFSDKGFLGFLFSFFLKVAGRL